jgi:hypothetical protein
MNPQHKINRAVNRIKRLKVKTVAAPLDKPKADRLAELTEQLRKSK